MNKYDVVGDVHGCYDELLALLLKLGYCHHTDDDKNVVIHPHSRQIVFVGDLADRGPKNTQVYELVMDMVETGAALSVLGNHDDKLRRWLKGNPIKPSHGLSVTIGEFENRDQEFKDKTYKFLCSLPIKLVLDDDKLLVSHAGLSGKYQDGGKKKTVRSKCLYGETTGREIDGFPERLDWAASYDGRRIVVHGHVKDLNGPIIKNNVFNIDTGCVFGGKLTALRYPEMEIVSVNSVCNWDQKEVQEV